MSALISRPRASYRARLRNDLSAVIESEELGLSNLHRQYLRSRWLEQVLRMEQEVSRAINRYYALRMMTVIGCLVILVLVSLKLDDPRWAMPVRYVTIALSLLVAISVALDQVFQYGRRWWQAERVAERLKTEGWRFLQLSGRYRHFANHTDAFPVFANQVEDLSQHEIEAYVAEIIVEKEREVSTVEKVASAPIVEEVESAPTIDLPLIADEPPPLATPTPRDTLRDRVTRHLNQRQAR